MTLNLLKLRIIQAQRIFTSLGFLYSLFVLIVYGLTVYKLFFNQDKETHQVATIFFAIIIFSIHVSRNDKQFLSYLFPQYLERKFALEYSLLLLPFSFPLLFGDFKIGYIITHLVAIGTPYLKSKITINFSVNYLIFKFIPKYMFEWRAGMRKNQYIFFALYLLAFGIGLKFGQAFIIIGLITFVFSSFYNEAEPLNFLIINHNNAKSFLHQKLQNHLKWYLILILPLFIFFSLKYSNFILFYIPLFIIYILNFIVFILNKYKSYIPNKLNNSNTVITGFIFAGIFLPFLFPISVILVFVYYQKSIKNLNQYFNADNQ